MAYREVRVVDGQEVLVSGDLIGSHFQRVQRNHLRSWAHCGEVAHCCRTRGKLLDCSVTILAEHLELPACAVGSSCW